MIATLPLRHTYSIHGLRVAIYGDPGPVRLLDARLRHFPHMRPGDRADAAFEFYGVDPSQGHVVERPRGPARSVYDHLPSAEVLYLDWSDRLYVDYGGRVRVLASPSDGHVRVSLLTHPPENAWIAAHVLFTIALMELAKRHGLYPLHAAGLCLGGQALVLPGTSGAGKTTLVLALLRAGFDLLADDVLFIDARDGRLQALGFPDVAGITDQTASLFPEVQPHLARAAPARRPKRLLYPEEVYGSAIGRAGTPAALVFPRVAGVDTSALAPVDRGEAFAELIAHLLPTEPRSSQAHLDVLARLARECPCYRLETGRDFERLASLLRSLLRRDAGRPRI